MERYEDILQLYKNADAYPNLKVLYEAALVCPSTSVDCERGFSQFKIHL
jgi:hypothetical protein